VQQARRVDHLGNERQGPLALARHPI
jgi:hypothetical protein